MLDKNIYKLEKPITYKIDTGNDVIPMEIVAIEFQDIDFHTVRESVRGIRSCIMSTQLKATKLFSQEERSKVQSQEKKVENEGDDTPVIPPKEMIKLFEMCDTINDFEKQFDKFLIKCLAIDSHNGKHAIEYSFLNKIGAITKNKLMASFLGFSSELYK